MLIEKPSCAASRESTVGRLVADEQLYEFLRVCYGREATAAYARLQDGDVDDEILFYACFFLALKSHSRSESIEVPYGWW